MTPAKITWEDFYSQPDKDGIRHFDDAPTARAVAVLTDRMEQRLRAEGWLPPDERGRDWVHNQTTLIQL